MSGQVEAFATVAVTRGGVELLRRIASAFPGADLYVPRRFAAPVAGGRAFDPPLRHLIPRLWSAYPALVFVAATGVVVRLVAPLLRDKTGDPGVVVVDEAGRFAIALTGGHLGGAEALARSLAEKLSLTPVLTTGSAVHGYPALDLLGTRYGWAVIDDSGLRTVSAAIVNGDPVALYRDAGDASWAEGLSCVEPIAAMRDVDPARHRGVVVISDRVLSLPRELPVVHYCPRTLTVGMGCERGTDRGLIADAFDSVLRDLARRAEAVAAIATADLKGSEPGLCGLATSRGIPLLTFSVSDLAGRAESCPTPSDVVRDAVGTAGVAEPAALLSAGSDELLVSKRVFKRDGVAGAVTVAVARLADRVPSPKGALLLVGIGPGSASQMTEAARQALQSADAVIGYTLYIDLVRPILRATQQVVASPIGAEARRADLAVRLAREGHRVALISSGDIGIYGMAGRALERLNGEDSVAVEVYPGVSAIQAAAARVGAPLMDDFAAVNLSDRLTPRDLILTRLRAAAEADFVIALYNPRSASRTEPFDEALRIVRQHRPARTPVAIVRSAYRPDERVAVTDLASIKPEEVDMLTIVLIGNRSTRVQNGWMITRRAGAS